MLLHIGRIMSSLLLFFLWGGKPLSGFLSASVAALKPRSLSLSFLLTAESQAAAL